MASLYCAVKSIHFANLAGLNFGIISCCFIVSIIINCACGYFCFNEEINYKVVIGICVTISGIIWISLAKGQAALNVSVALEEEVTIDRYLSILFALGSGCMNALTTVNAKFMVRKGNYDAMCLSSDTGLCLGLTCFLFSIYFTLAGYESSNLRNLFIAFCGAVMNMLT